MIFLKAELSGVINRQTISFIKREGGRNSAALFMHTKKKVKNISCSEKIRNI